MADPTDPLDETTANPSDPLAVASGGKPAVDSEGNPTSSQGAPTDYGSAFGQIAGGLGSLVGPALGLASGAYQLSNAGPTQAMTDAYNNETNLLNKGGSELGTGQSYIDAMLQGQSNPLFAQQYGQRNQVLRGQIGSALTAMQNANARSLAMGGPGLLNNQDRRDETVARAYGQGVENAGNQAYTDTTNLFGTAAQDAQRLGASYAPLGLSYSALSKALADQQAAQQGQTGAAFKTIAGAVSPTATNPASPSDTQQASQAASGLGSLISGIGSLFG